MFRSLNMRKMAEETSTTEDEIELFMDLLEHQWMMWDLSDPSCKNRYKRRNVLLQHSAEDLVIFSLLLRTEVSEDILALNMDNVWPAIKELK